MARDMRATAIQNDDNKAGQVHAVVYVGDQIARVAGVLEGKAAAATESDTEAELARVRELAHGYVEDNAALRKQVASLELALKKASETNGRRTQATNSYVESLKRVVDQVFPPSR